MMRYGIWGELKLDIDWLGTRALAIERVLWGWIRGDENSVRRKQSFSVQSGSTYGRTTEEDIYF